MIEAPLCFVATVRIVGAAAEGAGRVAPGIDLLGRRGVVVTVAAAAAAAAVADRQSVGAARDRAIRVASGDIVPARHSECSVHRHNEMNKLR